MAKYRKLGRTASQRKALLRNQVTMLLTHGKIVTTESKAKEVRKIAEGLIALAVKEKDNFEEVTVTAKVARKDKDGKRVKEVVDGKKVTVYDEVEKTIKKDMPSRLHARRQMLETNVGRLPVVDDDALVGMITSKDLMRAFIDFRKKVPEKYQKSQIKELLVEDIMSINPTFVSKDMSITEVSNIIMETGFNGLPVVENDEVVGIITQTDILRLIEKLES